MNRPLWRIFLTIFVGAFAAQRGVVAVAFLADGTLLAPGGARVVAIAHGVEALAAAVSAVGIWLGRRWVLAALGVLGTAIAASGLIDAFHAGIRSPFAAVSQAMAAALFTGGLVFLLNRELDDGAGRRGDSSGDSQERESRDVRSYPEPSMRRSP